MDPLTQAEQNLTTIIKGVGEDQLDSATPCTEWDAKALLDHIIASFAYFGGLATGQKAPAPKDAKPEPLTHEARKEKSVAAVTEAVQAWQKPGMAEKDFGQLKGAFYVNILLIELYAHAWDLATATKQTFPDDGKLAAEILPVAQKQLGPYPRQGAFGPEVAVEHPKSDTDRLVAFLGRHPQ